MDFDKGAVKNLDLLSGNLLPNRYHLEYPFELLHVGVRYESPSSMSCFMANTGGTYYTNTLLKDLPYTRQMRESGLLHAHDYYEFMLVIEGEIYQNIDCLRHYYPRGGCCIVGPELPHSEEYNENTHVRLLFFKLRKDYAASLLALSHFFAAEDTEAYRRCASFFSSAGDYLDFFPQKDFTWQAEKVHSLFEKMVSLMLSPGESTSLEMALLIYKTLMLLFDRSLYGNTPVQPGTEEEQRLFQDIRRYMESRMGKCTRADLIREFHFSGDYLYKVVKNHSGLSIHDYNTRICMKKAAELLSTTDKNVGEIAELLGFHNYTQFYAAFRRSYGVTPRQYRLREQG